MSARIHIVVDIALFALFLVAPWWVCLPCLLLALVYIDFYIEIVFFGFLFDILYGGGHTGLVVSTGMLIASLYIKPLIRV
jgi:membrane protein YdbS with pleckstrin-like domain